MTALYADASVTAALVRALRARRVTVVYGLEINPSAPDSDVLSDAAARDLVLITEDTDFGALVFASGASCAGVVLIRRPITSATGAGEVAAQILGLAEAGRGAFSVIDEAGVRSRPLPPKPASPPSSGN